MILLMSASKIGGIFLMNRINVNQKFEQIPDQMMLNPADISLLLNISKETVRRWCRTGKLESYNWGGKYVICASDFKEFLRNSKRESVV